MARFDFRNMKIFQGLAREGVKRGNMAVAKLAQNSMRDNFSRTGRYTSSAPGMPPNIRRGFLRRSIQVRPKGDMSAEVWSDSAYAMIHEKGGIIRPKTRKYLTIPLNDAAIPASQLNHISKITIDGVDYQTDGEFLNLCSNDVVYQMNVFREV